MADVMPRSKEEYDAAKRIIVVYKECTHGQRYFLPAISSAGGCS